MQRPRTSESRHRALLAALCTLSLVVFAGCTDPAEDKPAAVVEEPAASAEPHPTPPDVAQRFTFTEDTSIGFEGSKVFGSHVGGFARFEGSVTVPESGLEQALIHVLIHMDSTYSDDPELTTVLKGEKFFEVETYPTSEFRSTSIQKTPEGFDVTGNLQLHGVTKTITFPATIEIADDKLTAQSEFSINRADFGITYPGNADDLIREKVLIFFDLEAVPQNP